MPSNRFVTPRHPAAKLRKVLFASIFAFLSIGAASSASAVVIAFQGFEETAPSNAWGYTISDVVDASLSASAVTGTGEFPANQRIFEGSRSLQAFSTIATPAEGSSVITFNNVDVSLYDNLSITMRVSGTSTTSGNGIDGNDYMRLFVSVNGAAYAANSQAAADVALNGLANARWGYDATRTSTSNAGTPTVITATGGTSTNNYSTITINLADATALAGLRINFSNVATGEVWSVDNVTLNGTLTTPEPSKAVLLILGLGCLIVRRRRTSIFA